MSVILILDCGLVVMECGEKQYIQGREAPKGYLNFLLLHDVVLLLFGYKCGDFSPS